MAIIGIVAVDRNLFIGKGGSLHLNLMGYESHAKIAAPVAV